jgi:hypothetical protein
MNFLQQWFHRQPRTRGVSSTYNWPGHSGKEYPYEVYSLDTILRPVPGNYIYAKLVSAGDWSPVYIAQTRDLHQRLEGHVTLQEAIDNGATHLHVHCGAVGQAARCTEEHDLIERWQPVCNDPIQS